MAIDTTRALIAQIKNASQVGENTATRVGNTLDAMLDDIKDASDLATSAETKADNVVSRIAAEESVNNTQDTHIAGLQAALANVQQVTINGNVTNNPDQVFLTAESNKITPKERTTANSAKGYYIMRQADDFAAKLKANYIHELPFDIDTTGETFTIPSGAVLKFAGGKFTGNGHIVFQDTLLDGDVQFASTVNISGTIANYTAKQSWIENNNIDAWHKFINNVGGAVDYCYTEGEYTTSVLINKSVDKQINIIGNGAVITFPHTSTYQKAINITPSNTEEIVVKLTAQAVKGDTSIPVADVSDFAVGDICALHDHATSSFSPMRDYQQGEFLFVRNISGSDIIPDHAVYGNYTHLTEGTEIEDGQTLVKGGCTLTKFHLIGVAIRDLTLKLSGYVATDWSYGIYVNKASAVIENVEVYDFSHGINLSHCIFSSVRQCKSVSNILTQTGTDSYGLAINNSQNIIVDGGRYEGGNHGVTHGGSYNGNLAIVNRYCSVLRTQTRATKFTYGIDAHADSEFIFVKDNETQGIAMTAPHSIIEGNSVSGDIGFGTSVEYDYIIKDNKVGGSIGFGFDTTDITYNPHTFKNIIYPSTQEQMTIEGNVCGIIEADGRFKTAQSPNLNKVRIKVLNNTILKRFILDVYPQTDSTYESGAEIFVAGNIINATEQPNRIIGNKISLNDNIIKGSGLSLYGGELVELIGNNITYRVYINKSVNNAALIRIIDNYFNENAYVENLPGDISQLSTDALPSHLLYVERNKFSGVQTPLAGQLVNLTDTSVTKKVTTAIIRDNYTGTANLTSIKADNYSKVTFGGNFNTYRSQLEKPTYTSGKEPTTERNLDINFGAPYSAYIGYQYFSETLFRPAWYDGTRWVDGGGKPLVANVGATSGRPTLDDVSPSDRGMTYYDTTLNKVLFLALKRASSYTKHYVVSANSTSFQSTSALSSNTYYNVLINRTGVRKLYFSPTNVFVESDCILAYEGTTYGNIIIKTPDLSAYPYVYMVTESTSTTNFDFYTIATLWAEADGASAGVLRSGTTANRPASADIYVGFQYLDTSLTPPQPIFWDGSNWVKADGTTA